VKIIVPMNEPLETVKCKKCGKVIAEPKELVRINKKATSRMKEELQRKYEGYLALRKGCRYAVFYYFSNLMVFLCVDSSY